MQQNVSHYRIVEKLGEGGMGAVYLAEDLLLERRVAIKFPALSDDGDERARFLREARLASSLNHPHIATIHDFGETEDGHPFLVMELVEGESLDRVLDRDLLPVERSLRIAVEIASALEEAHRRGIVHRDIKPSNVAFTAQGAVKVLDFGLAKKLPPPIVADPANEPTQPRQVLNPAATRPGVAVGTPLYMSPEQVRGEELDGRSDLFSLGVLLHECLSGAPPFTGANFIEIRARILHAEPAPPSQRNPRVPSALDRITQRALAKQPADRYPSAAGMRADLEAALSSVQDEVRRERARTTDEAPPPVASLGSRFRSGLQAVAGRRGRTAASVLLVLVAVAVLAWMFRPTAPGAPSPEARSAYERGVAALRDGALLTASRALEFAVEVDPKFALAHARLAETWVELDNIDKASYEIATARVLVPSLSALPAVEAHYLQAINETITRNYAGAVEHYREIAKLDPDKPYVYFDLGRALERAEDWKPAIEQHQQALRRDPGYAAAHLRLGILYGRIQDQDLAADHFDDAERLYKTFSNQEGITETVYQRGLMFLNADNFPAARRQLEAALEAALSRSPNEYQQIRARLQLSTVASQESDPAKAKQYAEEAQAQAQARGIEYLTTSALIRLGDIYFRQNRITDAEDYMRRGLKLAQRYKTWRYEAMANGNLGSLLIERHQIDEGLALVEKAHDFFKRNGYQLQAAQALGLIRRTWRNRGDYEAALKAFEDDLRLAEQGKNKRALAALHDEIGQVLMRIERYPDALRHFDQGLETNRERGDKEGEFFDLSYAARVCERLGLYQRAAEMLDHAMKLAGTEEMRTSLLPSQADLALSRGRFREALAKSRQARARADTKDEGFIWRTNLLIAKAQLGAGEVQEARRLAEENLTAVIDWNQPPVLAQTRAVLAAAQLAAGEAAAARETARAALSEFERAGQRDSQWRARLLLAQASLLLNEPAVARQEAERAAAALTQLTEGWEADHARSYRARPDVVAARRELDALLAGK